MDDFFILKKAVDKSVLCQGFSIPKSFQNVFYKKIGFTLSKGQSTKIHINLSGTSYEVKIINQDFDPKKYPNHTEILQIRYDGNQQFIDALRIAFSRTWTSLQEYRAENNLYAGFKVSKDEEEYLSVYACPNSGELLFEVITNNEYKDGIAKIKQLNEMAFESQIDNTASLITSVGLKKIRHLSVGIGNSLKEMYGYRCQICGQFIGEKYGSTLIHAHHIDYFTKSLNNNSDNIMVLCPNHHGIIHDTNPVFNRGAKEFEYPNGYREGLKLNKHLY